MTPLRSALIAALAALLIAACARDSAMSESRKAMQEGRAEEALQVLEKAAADPQGDRETRQEYFRLRALVTAQSYDTPPAGQ